MRNQINIDYGVFHLLIHPTDGGMKSERNEVVLIYIIIKIYYVQGFQKYGPVL